MYYNGFFGVLKERNGKFEGYIKDIPEDIYYSGATEEEAQAAFRREVDKYIAERRKRRRVIAWVVSGVVVALVVALASSCPDSRKHKDKFSEVVLASVMNDKDMGELGMLSSLFGVDNIFAKYCESLIYTEDYFLFSVGYMQRDEKIQTVSVGVLGRVLVTKKPSELKALFDEWEW